ncbi:MAG TPA: Gfo/Idh/MocA family oxidoreductase [Candidatus Acidoferrum sp.]|nr:Gfo/Idh/MocA family oxidoreductase [Candidatus Acidoferrum sp.]
MLGAAWIADVALLPAIDRSRNGRLVALASRSHERAREILAPYPRALVVDSYDAVLELSEVDAVYIPLVNNLHLQWTLRALARGKHVLCEKPLAMNATEAEDMAAVAARSERLLMEAFMYRFDPRVRDFVAGISEPLHVQASFGFTLNGEGNYRFDAALGGGALLDVGCYGVSVSRWILGEPVDVVARARFEGGVDLTASVLLGFDGGPTASVFASFESAENQEVTVIGRRGVQRLERPFNRIEDPLEPYRVMVESFADSILEGRPAEIPWSESIANMQTLDRIRAAFSS